MLQQAHTLRVKIVKAVPLPVSVGVLTVGVVLLALPLAWWSQYVLGGDFTQTDAIVVVVTTSVISLPVGCLMCSTILYLHRSETRLAEARSAMSSHIRDLVAARRDADAASRAKSSFLAQMSHELRTPLNAVIGFSGMLAKQEELGTNMSRDQVIEYAGLISEGGTTLLSLVNDLLDLSKIEAGEMEMSAERFSIATALESASNCVAFLARERGIKVRSVMPVGVMDMVADKRALVQMLTNLLSNAVKFSPQFSEVTTNVRMSSRYLTFTITDRGAGMTAEELEKAVKPFAQLSNAMIATQKGTGLGLPIVKSLIELEDGSLVIDSEPGVGTTVSLRYPASRVVTEREALALSA